MYYAALEGAAIYRSQNSKKNSDMSRILMINSDIERENTPFPANPHSYPDPNSLILYKYTPSIPPKKSKKLEPVLPPWLCPRSAPATPRPNINTLQFQTQRHILIPLMSMIERHFCRNRRRVTRIPRFLVSSAIVWVLALAQDMRVWMGLVRVRVAVV
jgi:hypothetical protein